MNKIILTCLLCLSIPHVYGGGRYDIIHYNLTFAPDLSNRVNPNLYKRPLSDVDILQVLTSDLYPAILRCKRAENQQDRLRVDFINKGLINQYGVATDQLTIDFSQFANQNQRMAYIMNRDHVKRTLMQDENKLLKEFTRINTLAAHQNFGADIWTYLNEGLSDDVVLPDGAAREDNGNTYTNKYRNVMIMTTDGYIEAGIFDKGFDLSKQLVDRFRTAYLASGESDLISFFKHHKQFRITPVHNDKLKNLEILVMELYDRSLTKTGAATVHPTDMEIIQLFWTDWLKASKVKRFELKPCANSKAEAEKTILDFLDVTKLNP